MSEARIFQVNPGFKLVLASTSPRRSRLLADSGLAFSIHRPDFREGAPEKDTQPGEYAARMAARKAATVPLSPGATVIAADTVVCLDDTVLGKPSSAPAALAMLKLLNGREHHVITAVRVILPDSSVRDFSSLTKVHFGLWDETTLHAYVRTGSPLDKAGAYGIQDEGSFLVERIEGSYTNVVGLPLAPLIRILLAHGIIGRDSTPGA